MSICFAAAKSYSNVYCEIPSVRVEHAISLMRNLDNDEDVPVHLVSANIASPREVLHLLPRVTTLIRIERSIGYQNVPHEARGASACEISRNCATEPPKEV